MPSHAAPNERTVATLALQREEKCPGEVAWIRGRMDHYGCLEYARQVAQGIAGAAQEEYEAAFRDVPDSRDRRFLEGLATWVFERN